MPSIMNILPTHCNQCKARKWERERVTVIILIKALIDVMHVYYLIPHKVQAKLRVRKIQPLKQPDIFRKGKKSLNHKC